MSDFTSYFIQTATGTLLIVGGLPKIVSHQCNILFLKPAGLLGLLSIFCQTHLSLFCPNAAQHNTELGVEGSIIEVVLVIYR